MYVKYTRQTIAKISPLLSLVLRTVLLNIGAYYLFSWILRRTFLASGQTWLPKLARKEQGKNVEFPFFRFISEYFFFFQIFLNLKFTIPNPDQPPYDLTWRIRFSGPKQKNSFPLKLYLVLNTFKRISSLSVMTIWTGLSAGLINVCRSARCHQAIILANTLLTDSLESILKIRVWGGAVLSRLFSPSNIIKNRH